MGSDLDQAEARPNLTRQRLDRAGPSGILGVEGKLEQRAKSVDWNKHSLLAATQAEEMEVVESAAQHLAREPVSTI